jgi:predicted transposase/invertase (TIGR01784 family)
LDIEGISEKELSDTEIQLTPMNMVNRGFLQAGQLAGINAKRGDTMREVLKKMPRILMINLNWFHDRPKHPDFTQPVDLIYRKPDPETKVYERASEKVHIYNVEITKFIEKVLPSLKDKAYDPKTPRLHYWLWALCESQANGILLTEVIQMNKALQEFIKNDSGFEQYANRYEEVSSDLLVRWQFAAWTAEMDKQEIWRALGKEEGKAEGKTEGIAEGKAEEKAENAKRMLTKGVPPDLVADYLDLPLSEVEKLVL